MPTYEYVCVDCAHRFEVSRPIGDASLTVCEICGGKLRKVFHPIGVVLKGSGFYRTESRSKVKEATDKKEPAKTEAKPAPPSTEKQEKTA